MKKRKKKVEKELKEMQEKGNKFFTEFKAFVLRGNVMVMAVGVIIGGAFSGIVTALTTDIINPLINGIGGAELGGRTAEEITFGEITTGAHNDFEKATKIARAMVTEYGMSDLGPLQFEQQSGSVFLGRDYNKPQHFSNEVANEIDMEMRKIINDCHKNATDIIKKNKDLLKLIAETLLEYETLTKEQIDYLVENGKMPEEDDSNLEALSITKLREMAKEKGIKNYDTMSKAELLKELDN